MLYNIIPLRLNFDDSRAPAIYSGAAWNVKLNYKHDAFPDLSLSDYKLVMTIKGNDKYVCVLSSDNNRIQVDELTSDILLKLTSEETALLTSPQRCVYDLVLISLADQDDITAILTGNINITKSQYL